MKTSGYNPFENPTGIWFTKGDYINLAYKASSLQQYYPEKGLALIDFYDRIVDIGHELMG